MNTQRFTERTASRGHVDHTAGIIAGVKLLGPSSRNGRKYAADAMAEAVPLYDGVKVFLGHPESGKLGEDRRFDDWIGVVTRPRFESGAIYGDIKLRRKSPRFEELIEAATVFDVAVGMSHVADGHANTFGDEEVIEKITEVFSVDLVLDPATTAGLFEAVEGEHAELARKLRGMVAKLLKTPGVVENSGEEISELVTAIGEMEERGKFMQAADAVGLKNAGPEFAAVKDDGGLAKPTLGHPLESRVREGMARLTGGESRDDDNDMKRRFNYLLG